MIVTPILKPLLPPAAASSATRRWMWCEWASVRSTLDTLCGCCVSFPHESTDELRAFGLQVAQFHLFSTKNERSLLIDALYLCVLHGRPCCIQDTYAKIGGMSVHFFYGFKVGRMLKPRVEDESSIKMIADFSKRMLDRHFFTFPHEWHCPSRYCIVSLSVSPSVRVAVGKSSRGGGAYF